MAQEATKAKPKARKTTARKTTARKTVTRKAATRNTTARKAAPRKTAAKAQPTALEQAQELTRKLYLVSLGVYGVVFDSVEEQVKAVEERVTSSRKSADKVVNNLVKRGEKLEKEARKSIDDIDLPTFDRAEFDKQLEKAKERFEELKETINIRSAA